VHIEKSGACLPLLIKLLLLNSEYFRRRRAHVLSRTHRHAGLLLHGLHWEYFGGGGRVRAHTPPRGRYNFPPLSRALFNRAKAPYI
jgi:hypothetical protein